MSGAGSPLVAAGQVLALLLRIALIEPPSSPRPWLSCRVARDRRPRAPPSPPRPLLSRLLARARRHRAPLGPPRADMAPYEPPAQEVRARARDNRRQAPRRCSVQCFTCLGLYHDFEFSRWISGVTARPGPGPAFKLLS